MPAHHDEPLPDETVPDVVPLRQGEVPKSASVLIVDDNVQNAELIQAYLEDVVDRVMIAFNGQEAIDLIAQDPPDLVLLDVMMPKMSGFQVCQKLKSDPATKGIPVVVVTALNEQGDVERALEAGADDFLTKPVHKVELLTRVRQQLRLRLLRSQLDEFGADSMGQGNPKMNDDR